jgi:hypothetical protein
VEASAAVDADTKPPPPPPPGVEGVDDGPDPGTGWKWYVGLGERGRSCRGLPPVLVLPLPWGRGKCAERWAGRNEAGMMEKADESADFIMDERWRW